MTVQWEEVYVFISSTFNDMHAERDYLVKQVFPRLQEWCERRRLHLVDIDLRWGVTEADATQNKRVVQVCLERIDACRPFFLCFLGQRRGWVPARDDISPETYARYPELERCAGDTSVTEMEILHALVNPLHRGRVVDAEGAHAYTPAEHSFFYLREPGYLAELPAGVPGLRETYTNEGIADTGEHRQADSELARWRTEEVPRTRRPAHAYTAHWEPEESTPEIRLPLQCPSTAERGSSAWQAGLRGWGKQWARAGVRVDESGEIVDSAEREKAERYNARLAQGRLGRLACRGAPLAEAILADLQAAIQARYPSHVEAANPSPLQRELDQQAQFLETAGEGFIEREGDFDALDRYVRGDSRQAFFLAAPGGLGKTSLLARWIGRTQLGLKAGESLHFRFVGASDGSTTVDALLRSLLGEIKEISGKLPEEIPAGPDKLRAELPALLKAAGERGKTVLVLDGLNQIETGLADLAWLPLVLPPGIKLVASFKRGEPQAEATYEHLRAGGQAILAEVKPFASPDDRRRLVRAYLSQYLKELDERHVEALIASAGAGNPLYLKVVLAELRVFGAFADLGEKIRSDFGDTPVSAFAGLLRRLETDPAYSPVQPDLLVPRVFGWLAHARAGLTAKELAGLLVREGLFGDDDAGRRRAAEAVQGLLRQVRPYLARREGRADFFYESFKLAVLERYVWRGDPRDARPECRTARAWHASLGRQFCAQPLRLGSRRAPNRHTLFELPYQLALGGMSEPLRRTLWDYTYLLARLETGGAADLIADYDLAFLAEAGLERAEQEKLGRLRETLRMSAHVVGLDSRQLPSQLTARLLPFDEREIRGLLRAARCETSHAWLRPLTACLDAPGGPLVHTLRAGKSIRAVALTADGALALSVTLALSRGVIVAWDVTSGKELGVLAGHAGAVNAVAVTPDGSLALSASSDKTLRVWDLSTLRRTGYARPALPPLTGHNASVTAVAVTPDGLVAVSGSQDHTLKVWDVRFGAEVRTLAGHTATVNAVALSADGRVIVSASDDETVRVWDTGSGRVLHTLTGHGQSVRSVALSADGRVAISSSRRLALDPSGELHLTASRDGWRPKIWDVVHGVELRTLAGHTDDVASVALTPDGSRAVTGSYDLTLRVWNVATGRAIGSLEGHADAVSSVAIAADGRLVVSGSGDYTIKLWRVPQSFVDGFPGGDAPRVQAGHSQRVNAVAFRPDGRIAISASDDTTLRLWDVAAAGSDLGGPVVPRTLGSHSLAVSAVTATPDGQLAVSGSRDSTLKVWSLRAAPGAGVGNTAELHTLRGGSAAVAVALTPDGRLALAGSSDGALRVWDVTSGLLLHTLTGHKEGISAVAIAPDGSLAVSAAWDASIKVWDLVSGMERHTLSGHKRMVTGVVISPDGRIAVSAEYVGPAKVWDLASGQELFTLTDKVGVASPLAIAPDGRTAVLASPRYKVQVWDILPVAQGSAALCRSPRCLTGHTTYIELLGFTPDGRLVASAAADSSLRLWDVRNGSVVTAYSSDGGARSMAIAPDGRCLAIGDDRGDVHLLWLENVTPGPAIVTAWWAPGAGAAFGCPHCRTWSEVPESALDAELPCPHCGTGVKLNPFVVEADWRPVAAAWTRENHRGTE